jgi:hypothetical protein
MLKGEVILDKFYFLVFNNTHGAMKAESYLKSKEIRITIMPTPTQITKSCGISIIVLEDNLEQIKNIIADGFIEIKGLYMRQKGEYEKII